MRRSCTVDCLRAVGQYMVRSYGRTAVLAYVRTSYESTVLVRLYTGVQLIRHALSMIDPFAQRQERCELRDRTA
jgi:hypothetical protein